VREADEEEVLEEGEAEGGVEEEAQEVGEGGVADAVVGPGAVVVHFGDASFTLFTVVGSRWFRGIALSTPFPALPCDIQTCLFARCIAMSISLFGTWLFLHTPVLGYGPGINENTLRIRNPYQDQNHIRHDEFILRERSGFQLRQQPL